MTTYNIGLNTGNTGSITATTLDKGAPGTPTTRASGMFVGCVAGFANIARMVFDVSFGALSGPGTVTGTILKIANADAVSPAATYELRAITSAFTFAQTTWNSRLTGTSWLTAGAIPPSNNADMSTTVIGTGTAPTSGGDTIFNITGAGLDAWVQGCLDGSITNRQLILSKIDDTTVAESARRRFRTDQAVTGIRPLLTFDFVPATPPSASGADVLCTKHDGTTTITVTLSEAAPVGGCSVDYTTQDSTAIAGQHYTAMSGTFTFAQGEQTKTATVTIAP